MKMKTPYINLMIGVFSVIFFTVQAKACVTILCEAVCAQYKLTPNEVKLGKNGSDGTFRGQDYYKLVSRKAVYADGEKGYSQIFEQLKKKCAGSGELLITSEEKTKDILDIPPSNEMLRPSKACKRIDDSSSQSAPRASKKEASSHNQ